ncbi:hypothetical protein ACH4TE_20910 [Streptomyces sioyaensis]|uniref:hypothetical protein n=1 Tax=Streptomyces sioyaensis TaxID=67364 RepID=UPI003794D4BE
MASKVDALGWENWERMWFVKGDRIVFYNAKDNEVRSENLLKQQFTKVPPAFQNGLDAFGFENWERLWMFKDEQYCFYNAKAQEIREVRQIKAQFPGILEPQPHMA